MISTCLGLRIRFRPHGTRPETRAVASANTGSILYRKSLKNKEQERQMS